MPSIVATEVPDPPPSPPEQPLPSDCCGGGCMRCVFDMYDDALACYEAELLAWQQRHPEGVA